MKRITLFMIVLITVSGCSTNEILQAFFGPVNIPTGTTQSSDKAITAFGIISPAATGVIAGTNITITVPYGTSPTALVASFATTGASVKVGGTVQVSGTTTNDFTSPVVYTVTAADASVQTYLVTVTIASSDAKEMTAFAFGTPAAMGVITGTNIAITVPYGTSPTALVASFATTGASVKVGGTVQVSGTTTNDFTSPVVYTVTAADASVQTYLVTVTIALNSAKAITAFSMPAGIIWTARDSSRDWYSVASSSDGTKLVAIANGMFDDNIYTSTDSGVTWTARDSSRQWYGVASSSDGTKLVACVWNGQIYTSTDSGANWTARDSSRQWCGVASSSDGTKLVAGVSGGQIYTSTDSGVTWTPRDSSRNWQSVASSSDGTKLVACVWNGQIYTSTDSGVNWTARDSSRTWRGVASSSDGLKLVAYVYNGQIYTSTDSGANWTPRDSIRNWYGVASSSDGSKLVACDNGGQIYTSTDAGTNWTPRGSNKNWYGVASSSDGSKLVAVDNGGQIYTSAPIATIDEGVHTINVTLPTGTAKTALVFNFATTGASVKVGSTVQVSGVTTNDFTNPVTYTVTAEDATTQDYVVTVTAP